MFRSFIDWVSALVGGAHRQVLFAFIKVGIFISLGKMAGALREITIAWRFGVTEITDAFSYAFAITNFPVTIWLSAIPLLIIPLVATSADREEFIKFRSELYGNSLFAAVFISIIFYVLFCFSPIRDIIIRNAGSRSALTIFDLLLPMCLALPFSLVSGILAAETMAGRRHVNTLLEGTPAFFVAIFVLLPGVSPVIALGWGSLAGTAVQCLLLAWTVSAAEGRLSARTGFSATLWRSFGAAAAVVFLSQTLSSLSVAFDPFWAASYGEGVLASMTYANRIISLFVGLGAVAIGRAILPVLAAYGDENDMYKLASKWAWIILVIFSIVSTLIFIESKFIISILFQRGAFGADETNIVSSYLRIGIIHLPFFCSSLVFSSLLVARKMYSDILIGVIIGLFAKIIGNFVLCYRLGPVGLYFSTILMYVSSLVYCYFRCRPRMA